MRARARACICNIVNSLDLDAFTVTCLNLCHVCTCGKASVQLRRPFRTSAVMTGDDTAMTALAGALANLYSSLLCGCHVVD